MAIPNTGLLDLCFRERRSHVVCIYTGHTDEHTIYRSIIDRTAFWAHGEAYLSISHTAPSPKIPQELQLRKKPYIANTMVNNKCNGEMGLRRCEGIALILFWIALGSPGLQCVCNQVTMLDLVLQSLCVLIMIVSHCNNVLAHYNQVRHYNAAQPYKIFVSIVW